jgi:hypothetical protein
MRKPSLRARGKKRGIRIPSIVDFMSTPDQLSWASPRDTDAGYHQGDGGFVTSKLRSSRG